MFNSKAVDTAYTRLRIGGTKFSYKLCDMCNTKTNQVSHMLLECPKFSTARGKFKVELGLDTLTVEHVIKNSNNMYLDRKSVV